MLSIHSWTIDQNDNFFLIEFPQVFNEDPLERNCMVINVINHNRLSASSKTPSAWNNKQILLIQFEFPVLLFIILSLIKQTETKHWQMSRRFIKRHERRKSAAKKKIQNELLPINYCLPIGTLQIADSVEINTLRIGKINNKKTNNSNI